MIKGIIFDIGNVLCTFTNDILLNGISKLTGKSSIELHDLIYRHSGLPKKYETGLITSQEFYHEMTQLCDLHISSEELKRIYSEDKFTPIPGMNDLVKKLKGKYKIGLLSNTSEWDAEYLFKLIPDIKLFDSVSLSYQVKVMKPGVEIYKDALKKIELLPEECIYTDDILEYVTVAESLGMRAIHFKGGESFVKSLSSYLV